MNKHLELINNTINEIGFEENAFTIDNDTKAEWALSKIREEQKELARISELCQNMIMMYEKEIEKAEQAFERNTSG